MSVDDDAFDPGPADDDPAAAVAAMPDTRKLSRHPLLTDAAWSRLSEFAPEVLDSITNLTRLESEVRTFERPVGPDDAVILADALEAINRVNASLNAVTLAIFQRVGVPTDFGAKTTKALVKDRLGLSDQEAYRRTEAANNLGGRVDLSGQPMPPLAPKAADGLHEGVLSANQAAVIAECMKRLPAWVSAELRAETEERLVKEAPNVRVSDLREIFQRMLDIIDPDGKEPSEGRDRSDYSVHLRARRNGDWELSGRLDPITGGLLNGLLTSRIESCRTAGEQGGAEAAGGQGDAGNGFAGTEAVAEESPSPFDVLDAVLSGDRHDAPLFAQDGTGQRLPGTGTSADASGGTAAMAGHDGADGSAYGMRRDGTTVSTVDAQPSARRWIYERFASLIGKIEMNRPNSGARYSLVVTAKAEDLASRTGQGKTGTENPVPMSELTSSGLNGRVFFHLMSDSAKTVQVATEKRFADEKQTAIITARDMGCTFPGCDAPPGWCEVHHIVPWIDKGITDINNLTLACGAHHHLIDRSDWHAVMLTSGQPAWVPPASIDPERRPILHAKFVAQGIIDTLFDG
nr:HNH endonuclease signature motif containing protein [Brevibacterium sp. XM4083]